MQTFEPILRDDGSSCLWIFKCKFVESPVTGHLFVHRSTRTMAFQGRSLRVASIIESPVYLFLPSRWVTSCYCWPTQHRSRLALQQLNPFFCSLSPSSHRNLGARSVMLDWLVGYFRENQKLLTTRCIRPKATNTASQLWKR